jgi:hypothetical protein
VSSSWDLRDRPHPLSMANAAAHKMALDPNSPRIATSFGQVCVRGEPRRFRSVSRDAMSVFPMPDLPSLVRTIIALAVAFLLGTLIGFKRQWRQRSAGLRTTTLVATGAAAFADMGLRLRGVDGATQIIAYIVSGIGFLGAGVIL